MKYTFKPVKNKTRFLDVQIFLNDERRGTITLTNNEWKNLRAMLLHGRSFFQDNEATILVDESLMYTRPQSGAKHEGRGADSSPNLEEIRPPTT